MAIRTAFADLRVTCMHCLRVGHFTWAVPLNGSSVRQQVLQNSTEITHTCRDIAGRQEHCTDNAQSIACHVVPICSPSLQ